MSDFPYGAADDSNLTLATSSPRPTPVLALAALRAHAAELPPNAGREPHFVVSDRRALGARGGRGARARSLAGLLPAPAKPHRHCSSRTSCEPRCSNGHPSTVIVAAPPSTPQYSASDGETGPRDVRRGFEQSTVLHTGLDRLARVITRTSWAERELVLVEPYEAELAVVSLPREDARFSTELGGLRAF